MITIVGGGVQGFQQMTLEGLTALNLADQVLTFQWDEPFFKRHNINNVVSLASLYQDGARDEENYDRVIKRIESAAEINKNVAVLLPGHPRVGVSVVQRLTHRSDVKVLPGISSFATMINDLAIDPLERGSVLVDVNRLLLFDMKIVPELDYYFYHICSVGTAATHFTDPSKENSFHLLVAKLTETYPPEHKAILIGSATETNSSPTMLPVRIDQLESVLKDIRFETSLYIQGIRPRSLNPGYLNLLSRQSERAGS